MSRPQRYQVVGTGVDTIKVSAVGKLREEVIAVLDALQQQAIAQRDERRQSGEALVDSHWKLDGEPVQIRAHGGGKGQWRWTGECPSARFDFGLGKLNGIGCQVRLASPFLWRRGYRDAWDRTETFLRRLFQKDTWFQTSEIHLCADVAGLAVDQLQEKAFVTRSQVKRWHLDDALVMHLATRSPRIEGMPTVEVVRRYRERETLSFSLSAAHSVMVYNKPREIRFKSRDKAWFADIWRANGWNGHDPVTRVEARYGRAMLHELGEQKQEGEKVGWHGLETVAETFAWLDGMWAYTTQDWLRHTLPTSLSSERWRTSPWWQVVQGAVFEREQAEPLQRTKQRNFQEERMLAALLGYVESWSAWRIGEQKLSEDILLEDALADVLDRAGEHYAHKGTVFLEEVARKRKRLGFAG